MIRRKHSTSRHTFSVAHAMAIALLAVAAMSFAAAATALGAPGGRTRSAWLDSGSDAARAASSPTGRRINATLWAGLQHGPLGAGASLVGSTPVPPGPSAVAVDAATHTVYVASGNDQDGPTPVGHDRCDRRAALQRTRRVAMRGAVAGDHRRRSAERGRRRRCDPHGVRDDPR